MSFSQVQPRTNLPSGLAFEIGSSKSEIERTHGKPVKYFVPKAKKYFLPPDYQVALALDERVLPIYARLTATNTFEVWLDYQVEKGSAEAQLQEARFTPRSPSAAFKLAADLIEARELCAAGCNIIGIPGTHPSMVLYPMSASKRQKAAAKTCTDCAQGFGESTLEIHLSFTDTSSRDITSPGWLEASVDYAQFAIGSPLLDKSDVFLGSEIGTWDSLTGRISQVHAQKRFSASDLASKKADECGATMTREEFVECLDQAQAMTEKALKAFPAESAKQPATTARTGPFGFDYGMSKEQVIKLLGKESLVWSKGNDYGFSKAPKPYQAFEGYLLIISPEKGLLKIVAYAKGTKTNVFGDALKDEFQEIYDAVSKTYGAGKLYDYLKSGSIWNERQDWMMGLLQGDRILEYFWNSAKPTNHVVLIRLEASADSIGSGQVKLSYEFEGFEAYAEAEKVKNEKVF